METPGICTHGSSPYVFVFHSELRTQLPRNFVFHGGSGSEKHHITTALSAGVVKMNVDTDTQWAYWEGLLKFYKAKEGYLQAQIGNPEGEDRGDVFLFPEPRNEKQVQNQKPFDSIKLHLMLCHVFARLIGGKFKVKNATVTMTSSFSVILAFSL